MVVSSLRNRCSLISLVHPMGLLSLALPKTEESEDQESNPPHLPPCPGVKQGAAHGWGKVRLARAASWRCPGPGAPRRGRLGSAGPAERGGARGQDGNSPVPTATV